MLTSFLQLFFPHVCNGCGSDQLQAKDLVCARCMASLPYTGFIEHEGNPVEKAFYGRLAVQAAGSLLYYTRPSVVQNLVQAVKYRRSQETGIWLGSLLGNAIRQSERFSHINMVIPVPLHKRKERQRGYNQAGLIASGISGICHLPVINGVLVKQTPTATQTHKGRSERMDILKTTFTLTNPQQLYGKHILLVDDIMTTGATFEACGQILLRAQPASINIASIAYTLL